MKEQEQQVWQRVMGCREPVPETNLKALTMAAQEAAGEYDTLRRSMGGNVRELARKLWEGEQETLRSIKGLHLLQTGEAMQLKALPGQEKVDRRCLVRRFHTTRRLAGEYMGRSAESEWGCVFLALAKRQEMQCALLAQLLGLL